MSGILVTGGAGFIGSHLVAALLDRGHTVRVLDDFSTGFRENLPTHERLTILEGSVCDPETVAQAVQGIEGVFHQAARPSVQRSIDDPRTTCRINVGGTATLLEAARSAGVRRVVAAGSSSVYGNTPTLPKVETMPPSPRSPYAASKLAMEHLMTVYHRAFGLETVVLRYFNVFGPRQDPDSPYAAVIPIFIRAYRQDASPTIFGDGEQSRDFTFVHNVVQANLLALESPDAVGQAINVACGAQHTLNQLDRMIREQVETRREPNYAEPRAGDVRHSLADISLAASALGYRPDVSFEDGLQRTLQWHLSTPTG